MQGWFFNLAFRDSNQREILREPKLRRWNVTYAFFLVLAFGLKAQIDFVVELCTATFFSLVLQYTLRWVFALKQIPA